MYHKIVQKALTIWGLEGANIEFITQRENHLYRVTTANVDVCLRIHRQGLRSEEETTSELDFMAMLHANGMTVPVPILSLSKQRYHQIDDHFVDLLVWLNGENLGQNTEIYDWDNLPKNLYKLGIELAKAHNYSDQWELPENFVRPVWDREGLLSENAIWGKFWENHCLYFSDKTMLISVRDYANDLIKKEHDKMDFGLIHTDILPENVNIYEGNVQLMNFGDCGFGYRLFELATLLNKMVDFEKYEDYKTALLEGYRTLRPLDETYLLLFQTLRSFTYLSWIIPRMNEPGGSERCRRFIKNATNMAEKYMATI